MNKNLFVGGLVAAGFDPEGKYLLTVSHAGRGLFSLDSWECVARNYELHYPKNGHALGIGPIEGISIPVFEFNNGAWQLNFLSPDGVYEFEYEEGTISISNRKA